SDIRSLQDRVDHLEKELSDRDDVIDERDDTLRANFEEIRRLNGILDQIYSSRTWKLHLLAERLRGR
ncbi:MAG: hypothetical protein R3338_07920, partial [Thermoanaerobaculia bacterium]|nr:hypothetical protein [Thermoanaerobaculia bacterium]